MNLANLLTLSRIPALFLIAVLLTVHVPLFATAAVVVYILAALTDAFDGWVARRSGQVSDFGKLMDALVDKIFVLGLLLILAFLNYIPIGTVNLVAILVIATREWLVTGLRQAAVAKGIVLPAENLGKVKTTAQMVSIGCFLLYRAIIFDFIFWREVIGDYPPHWLELVGEWTLYLAAALALISALSYVFHYRRLG